VTLKEKVLEECTKLKTYVKNLKSKSSEKLEFLNEHENSKKFKGSKYYKFWPIIAIGVILIAIIGVMSMMNNNKSEVMTQFETAIAKNNTSKLSSVVKLDDGTQITSEQAIPILDFFKADNSRISNLKSSFKVGSSYYSMNLKKEKRFIGESYYIGVSYQKLSIDSNLDNTTLIINGEDKGVFNKDKTVELITPGEYNIELKNKNKYSTITKNQKIAFTKSTDIDMELKGTYVTVVSNVPEGIVYINDSSTGVKASDFKNVGPFPSDGSYEISLKYNTPFGTVISSKVKIGDLPDINLDLDLKSSGIKTSLNNLVGKFYESVFNAIDLKDQTKIEYANEEAKNKIYSDIKEKGFILKNVYKLNSSSIDFEKSTVDFKDGVYYASVVADIDYNVKKEILGVPLKSNDYKQSFFTKAKYQDGEWQIYDIQNFDLKSAE
jgi:uncharacterized membrane protein YvbJ